MKRIMSANISLMFAVFIANFLFVNSFQCKDDNNEPVDWFVAYKLPRLKGNKYPVNKGLGYAYMTSKNYSNWTLSSRSINDSLSMIANTVYPLFTDATNESAHLLYNDQPPDAPFTSEKGHTKGVILANPDGGLWLVHSVPKFPNLHETSFTYPLTGTRYGQSFLCISLNLPNLNEVGIQLQYNEPYIYAANIPNNLKTKIDEINQASKNVTVTKPPWYRKKIITSRGGVSFDSFAKSKRFNKDLYEDWLAPELENNLFVESWPNGSGKLPSNCTKRFKVYNVANIKLAEASVDFSTTHDHSKWAVTENSEYICVGDINRMKEQKMRGGGTVCLKNNKLASEYKSIITEIENCKA